MLESSPGGGREPPYLLDTDAVIHYLQGIPDSVSPIQDLHRRGGILCICDVVIAELYSGLRPEDRQKAHPLLVSLHYLSTSREAAQQAGEWRYAYARKGRALSTTDVLIAATAHAHRASLVTGNRERYPMPELSVMVLPRGQRR